MACDKKAGRVGTRRNNDLILIYLFTLWLKEAVLAGLYNFSAAKCYLSIVYLDLHVLVLIMNSIKVNAFTSTHLWLHNRKIIKVSIWLSAVSKLQGAAVIWYKVKCVSKRHNNEAM